MLTTEYLDTLSFEEKKKAIIEERIKCAKDYKYLIETYFSVDAAGSFKPFILFPHQIVALNDYISYSNNITMKTRQMGFTTFTSAYICAEIINNDNYKTLIISKEQNSSIEFVRKCKEILISAKNRTRISSAEGSKSWLIPEFEEGSNNKKKFVLTNGSFVEGQGNSEDSGRGVSGLNLCVVDEVAFIDRKSPERMNEIWAAVGPALSTTGGKAIMISTPFGTQGWYYDTYVNSDDMNFNIINAHWTMHPDFNQGMYKWVKDPNKKAGGYIKFLNKTWPKEMDDPKSKKRIEIPKNKYEFICDGKVRSPWYDSMSRRLGPAKTARELDCTFVGTGGEVLPQEKIRNIDVYSRSIEYRKVFGKGILNGYKEFEKPDSDSEYFLSCDVMTGDGRDYSTVVILKIQPKKLTIVGTLRLQIQPKYFAKIIKQLGQRFFNPLIIVENQGGGSTTLQELKELGVPNLYYSTLKKKDESSGGQKRKIGLWQDENTRTKGGDALEVLIIEDEIDIPCVNLANEFYTWIWTKEGRRDHAPGKNDDLIMALQNAIYVWKYSYVKSLRKSEAFKKIISINQEIDEEDENRSMNDPLYEEKLYRQKLQNEKAKSNSKIGIVNSENKTKYVPKIFF